MGREAEREKNEEEREGRRENGRKRSILERMNSYIGRKRGRKKE